MARVMPLYLVAWIWFCAYLNCAGWTLSALHQLNAAGYAVALALWVVGFSFWRKQASATFALPWPKLRRRFRRGFPMAFLALAAMALLGGLIYAPSNYDALAYRLPRMLQWLAAGHWHWVHTIFDRLNNRSCGMEWVSAPVIALCHSTRPLFLINFISFLFLPGLVFSVLQRLGVRRRVAWHWMWLMPTAYCLLLQAGSIGNDMFGVMFALAAVDFALRAAGSGGFTAFATSILAAAMMTAVKTNNLPFLLPWAVALLPSLKVTLRRPVATLLVAVLAAGGSGLPTIYFNWHMTGDWSGARLSNNGVEHAVVYRTVANAVSLSLQNLVPPMFPMADQFNKTARHDVSPELSRKLDALGEGEGWWMQVPQMQIEEIAGFGLGLTALLGVSFVAGVVRRGKEPADSGPGRLLTSRPARPWVAAVRWSSVLVLFLVLTQANVAAVGRLFAAYYILPCTLFLARPGHERLVRQRWWHGLAWLVFLMSAILLAVSPARPLFPRDAVLARIRSREAAHPALTRIDVVYSTYRERPTAFRPVLAALPADTRVLGYIAFDKPETSLWQPFGSRRIIHVCPGDSPDELKGEGVRYILVDADEFETWFNCPFTQWIRQMNAVVVREIPLRVLAGKDTQTWSLVELRGQS
jgi:hypothetical protein